MIALPKPRMCRGDEGSVSGVWMMFMLIIVLAAAGLVFDGGRALQGERYAANVAAGAARAGVAAQSLASLEQLGGPLQLDPAVAQDAAVRHAAAAGIAAADVAVVVAGGDVAVTVTVRRQAVFIALAGNPELVMHATGTARFTPSGVVP
jgi:hypothetical protein